MKLRFENNSVRVRVRKSELQQLKEHGFIQDTVAFPNAVFSYALHITDVTEITPALSGNSVAIYIPLATGHNWINTDEVGIYETLQLQNEHTLSIIIEKDFPCKDRPEEDRSDTFTELVDKDETGKVC